MGGRALPPSRGRRDPPPRPPHERPLRRRLGLGPRRLHPPRRQRQEIRGRPRRVDDGEGDGAGAAARGGRNRVQNPHSEGSRHEGEAVLGGGEARARRRHYGQPRRRRVQAKLQAQEARQRI